MPLKKKVNASKSNGKSPRDPAPVRDIREGRVRRRPGSAPRETAETAAAVVEARVQAQAQLKTFEHAIKLFHLRKFSEARNLFVQASAGPNRDMSHNAELHIRMCDRRLEKAVLEFRGAEDHYNYAVAMLNTRNLAAALEHLQAALQLDTQADYVYYALAVYFGLSGDPAGACENLKRAIDLNPRNRIAARQDADFSAIANQPSFRELLHPEKTVL